MSTSPWALFVTAKEVDVDYVNEVLSRAEKENFQTGWNLWVASSEYSDAPRRPEGGSLPEGSKPPLESLPSAWIGKTIEECAQWLSEAPDKIAVNKRYFAVISEHMKEEDTVMLCRTVEDVPEENEEDRGQLQYFPVKTERTDLIMMQTIGIEFLGKLMEYRTLRFSEGKPDRSKGGPSYP